jgi:hypothetical protein
MRCSLGFPLPSFCLISIVCPISSHVQLGYRYERELSSFRHFALSCQCTVAYWGFGTINCVLSIHNCQMRHSVCHPRGIATCYSTFSLTAKKLISPSRDRQTDLQHGIKMWRKTWSTDIPNTAKAYPVLFTSITAMEHWLTIKIIMIRKWNTTFKRYGTCGMSIEVYNP